MTWNHRVMKKTHKGSWGEEDQYTIREVFYDDDGEIEGWTATGVWPAGETVEGLKKEIHMFSAAFDAPVLDEDELEKKFPAPRRPLRPERHERAIKNLRSFLAAWEEENGPISEDEIKKVIAEWPS